jgi:hypothetical protein
MKGVSAGVSMKGPARAKNLHPILQIINAAKK